MMNLPVKTRVLHHPIESETSETVVSLNKIATSYLEPKAKARVATININMTTVSDTKEEDQKKRT